MGKGVFLSKKCSECDGKGGTIIRCSKEAKEEFLEKQDLFSEQERMLFENYSQGFSQEEIARNMDMPVNKVAGILYSIEGKLNKN
jgi:DNA-directed RNA polymerase specialized sigma24 family protein